MRQCYVATFDLPLAAFAANPALSAIYVTGSVSASSANMGLMSYDSRGGSASVAVDMGRYMRLGITHRQQFQESSGVVGKDEIVRFASEFDPQPFHIDPAAAAFTDSPWAYNGKIFALSEDGDTFVIQAGPEFKLLGKNTLDEMCMATPAIYRATLIVRTASKLYRIQKGAS